MNFRESEKINVTKHMEKKGRFTYLSWPFAVSEFRRACPEGVWVVESFGENKQPYCQTDAGCFVEVAVFPDVNKEAQFFTQVHPVLDNSNKSVQAPNAFQVNTSIQRCLVKAIALATGIGLHIYAGEDLPPSDTQVSKQEEKFNTAEYYNALAAEMGKCTDATKLDKWIAANKGRIDKLNETNKDRLRALRKQYIDIFEKDAKECEK